MKWLPYYKNELNINESLNILNERLSKYIHEDNKSNEFVSAKESNKKYIGILDLNGFRIHRNVYHQNPFLPFIRISLNNHPFVPLIIGIYNKHCDNNITIYVRYRISVYIQMTFYLLFSLIIGSFAAISIWIQEKSLLGILVPLIFCIIGYGMMIYFYNKELKQTLNDFDKLFKIDGHRANVA